MENQGETDRQFRHRLIQEEFRSFLASTEYKVPLDTQGVVVLSAPASIEKDGKAVEATPDNIERIAFGIEVIKHIIAKKSGKKPEEVTRDDILHHSPPLILNGDTIQIPVMLQITDQLEFPKEKIEIVDCGSRETANTKKQFEVLNDDSRYINRNHLIFITNDYHAPRVIRTADAHLKPEIHFDVLPVPHGRVPYNVFRVVRGEVSRIEKYSAKGDIARNAVLR